MNRRGFISLLAGAAGGGVVLWRLPEPKIFLPSRELEWGMDTASNLYDVNVFYKVVALASSIPERVLRGSSLHSDVWSSAPRFEIGDILSVERIERMKNDFTRSP